jgi:hypothetical protein
MKDERLYRLVRKVPLTIFVIAPNLMQSFID